MGQAVAKGAAPCLNDAEAVEPRRLGMTMQGRCFEAGGARIGFAGLLFFFLLGLVAGLAASRPAAADPARDAVIGALADELVEGLAAALPPEPGRKRRIALWPFEAQGIPIAKVSADEINAALLAALLARARDRYDFLPRESLRTLIADLERTGVWDEAGGAPVAALLRSAAEVDAMIEGRLRLAGGALDIHYRAIRLDGVVAAQTASRRLALEPGQGSVGTLSLPAAVEAAARHLSERASDMTELRLGGLRFETSGEQTPFGISVQDRLALALEDAYRNVLSDRRLKVIRSEDSAAPPRGRYLLTGTYWDFGDGIELRVSLDDGRSATASWIGRLSPDSAAGVAVRPRGNFSVLRDLDGRGPIGFEVASRRGRDPAYRIGESLDLTLKADREAWPYCFYRQSDRRWVRLFPNPYQPEARLTAGRAAPMAGRAAAFELKATGPAGVELVKCFAANRPLAAELPPELAARRTEPLDATWDRRLVQAFRTLKGADVSEASLVVTVLP